MAIFIFNAFRNIYYNMYLISSSCIVYFVIMYTIHIIKALRIIYILSVLSNANLRQSLWSSPRLNLSISYSTFSSISLLMISCSWYSLFASNLFLSSYSISPTVCCIIAFDYCFFEYFLVCVGSCLLYLKACLWHTLYQIHLWLFTIMRSGHSYKADRLVLICYSDNLHKFSFYWHNGHSSWSISLIRRLLPSF